MYKLNDIPLRNYGLRHGRATNSNIALSGFLDMPKRLGKTYHDWSGEPGTEPYVLASEIQHAGRTIVYHGYMKGDDRADAIVRVNELYTDISAFDDLATLSTPWGDFQVYVKDQIKANYYADGWVGVQIPFREPNVPTPNDIPTGSSIDLYHIDNVPYRALGAYVTHVSDNFNRQQTKEPHFSAYGIEGYQVTKMAPMEFTQELVFMASDFASLRSNVQKLHALLAAPGTRIMNIDNMERECFNVKGFELYGIRVSDGKCMCQMRLPMVMAGSGVPVLPEYLLDADGNTVLDPIFPIRTPGQEIFLLDADGNFILTSQYEKTTL